MSTSTPGERSDWFYSSGGVQHGPVAEGRLVELLATLPPDTMIWREGLSGWLEPRQVPEIAQRLRPAGPPPLPPRAARAAGAPMAAPPAKKSNMVLWVVAAGGCAFVGVAVIGIVAAIAIPSLLRAKVSANEAAAIGDIRTIISAEAAFQSSSKGYYGELSCLSSPAACIEGYSPGDPTFLDHDLASAERKAGYKRRFVGGSAGPSRGLLQDYCYQASPFTPGQTGVRSFGGDASGLVGVNKGTADCCTSDGKLDTATCPPLS